MSLGRNTVIRLGFLIVFLILVTILFINNTAVIAQLCKTVISQSQVFTRNPYPPTPTPDAIQVISDALEATIITTGTETSLNTQSKTDVYSIEGVESPKGIDTPTNKPFTLVVKYTNLSHNIIHFPLISVTPGGLEASAGAHITLSKELTSATRSIFILPEAIHPTHTRIAHILITARFPGIYTLKLEARGDGIPSANAEVLVTAH